MMFFRTTVPVITELVSTRLVLFIFSLHAMGLLSVVFKSLFKWSFAISLVALLYFFPTPSAGQERDKLRVGVIADLSGQTASFGESLLRGIEMAVDEINSSGGILSRNIEIFVEDDHGRPEKAKAAAERLIREHDINVLLGEVSSTNSLAAAYVLQEKKIPMISPASTNLRVTDVGEYIFRGCFADPLQGTAMAGFAFSDLHARRVAFLGDANSDYSRFLYEAFKTEFLRRGGRITAEKTYFQYDPTFRSQLLAIKKSKPDAIYMSGYYGQVAIAAREARKLGINSPLLGGDGWMSPELWKLGGSGLRNSYITSHFSPDQPSETVQTFIGQYKRRYNGNTPDEIAALAYDAVYLLKDALGRAQSVKGPDIITALASTKNLIGVTGPIDHFNEHRNPLKPVTVFRLDVGRSRFVYHKTIKADELSGWREPGDVPSAHR
jgi:branched-chain amino acid transport system substrate-binding protein